MISSLKAYGLESPYRSKRLMEQSIASRAFSLKGLVVLTEAASKNYVHTPVLAALAGADKVYAVTRDSIYGKASEVADFTSMLGEFCGVREKIEVVTTKTQEVVRQADVIMNLGFVRPITAEMVSWMQDTAVIPLMYEAWEFRPGDVDLAACGQRNIPVIATNGDASGLGIFKYYGPLCIKMLFEAQVEVYQSRIIVVSGDKFGEAISQSLKALGANVFLVPELSSTASRDYMTGADAIVIADFTSTNTFIGTNGQISANEFKQICPEALVIQFAGHVNISELAEKHIGFYPRKEVGFFRMGLTLGELGPKPVIDVHCAGLHVGEIAAHGRLQGLNLQQIESLIVQKALGQLMTSG